MGDDEGGIAMTTLCEHQRRQSCTCIIVRTSVATIYQKHINLTLNKTTEYKIDIMIQPTVQKKSTKSPKSTRILLAIILLIRSSSLSVTMAFPTPTTTVMASSSSMNGRVAVASVIQPVNRNSRRTCQQRPARFTQLASPSRRLCLNMIKPGGTEHGAKLTSDAFRRTTAKTTATAAAAVAAVSMSSSLLYPSLFFHQHQQLARNSFYLTRIVFLRALGFIYGVAFLVAKHQNKALIGDNGITPARIILNKAYERGFYKTQQRKDYLNSTYAGKPVRSVEGSSNNVVQKSIRQIRNMKIIRDFGMKLNRQAWFQNIREVLWDRTDGMGRPVTTLLWIPYNNYLKDRTSSNNKKSFSLNSWLDNIANCGLILSTLVFIFGSANVPVLLMLWICQRSLMSVGGTWYGFGWEPQLAELGFHALFLVPLWNLNSIPIVNSSAPSILVMYMIRWYLFRIMIGAGLIKIRSHDQKWKFSRGGGDDSKHLSAMDYFYETQPVPNPLTKYFHFMPHWWHQGEVLINHFVELVAPWLLLVPIGRSCRLLGGIIQILFQGILITSGNLSFLNWLTAIPAIVCLDDAILGKLFFSTKTRERALLASMYHETYGTPIMRRLVSIGFVALIVSLSVPVVKNLCSKQQRMNSSFDRLRLVNTYGAFGTVDEIREEFVISAASDYEGPWYEYEFKVKPGDIYRRPRFISPYHYRLDWLMWIASTIGRIDHSPWMYSLMYKLLEQDPKVLGLLAENPFQNQVHGPKYIRVDRYRYKFARRGIHGGQEGRTTPRNGKNDGTVHEEKKGEPYWERELIGREFPRQGIATKEMLKDYIYDMI